MHQSEKLHCTLETVKANYHDLYLQLAWSDKEV